MDNKNFKKQYKPAACNEAPFKNLIPLEIRESTLLKIKQESIDFYGEDLSGECSKRLVCVGKQCLGRPIPAGSPTATPYLEKLAKTHKIVGGELFIENCGTCPIALNCKSSCKQVDDFINRDKIVEPIINYVKKVNENVVQEGAEQQAVFNISGADIAWDCLPAKWQQIVELYLYEGKDFNHIAQLLGLFNEAAVKYKYYLALTKLSKYSTVRKFLQTNPKLPKKQKVIVELYFLENKKLNKIAKILGITKQACQISLKSFYEKNKLKWYKAVSKKDGEIVYNTKLIISR